MARIGLVALYDRFSIGLGSLRSFLQSRGHDVFVLYFEQQTARKVRFIRGYEKDDHHVMVLNSGNDVVLSYAQQPTSGAMDGLLRTLHSLDLDLVGISFRTIAQQVVFGLTGALREHLAVPLVYGGIAPTIEPEECIRRNDLLCRGEGEHALDEVAECMDRGASPRGIRNIWFRHDGGIERNPVRPLIQNLDELPFPDYAPENTYSIDGEGVREGVSLERHGGLYEIMTSRGCPFSCSFCCNSQLREIFSGVKGKYVRRRSVGHVMEELVSAKRRYGIRYVNFQDDVFTFDREWLREFGREYRKHVALPFWCYVHPSFTDEASLRLVKEAGVDHMTMGVQSGSEHVLREIYNRKMSPEAVLESGRLLKRLGIRYNIDIITNNPLERETDCKETLDLLLRMPGPVRFNGGLSKLSVYPATRIRELIAQKGADAGLDEESFTFYNTLYLLCQTHLPRRWIRGFQRSGWLRKNPSLLKVFLIRPWFKTDLLMSVRERLPDPTLRMLLQVRRRRRRKRL